MLPKHCGDECLLQWAAKAYQARWHGQSILATLQLPASQTGGVMLVRLNCQQGTCARASKDSQLQPLYNTVISNLAQCSGCSLSLRMWCRQEHAACAPCLLCVEAQLATHACAHMLLLLLLLLLPLQRTPRHIEGVSCAPTGFSRSTPYLRPHDRTCLKAARTWLAGEGRYPEGTSKGIARRPPHTLRYTT